MSDQNDFFTLLGEPPRARNTDPKTSHDAKQFKLNEDRIAVLLCHDQHRHGLTDFDLAAIMGRQQTSVGKRRGELRDYGYIEGTELIRPAPSGASAIVWRITVRGIALAATLRGPVHV